MSFCCLCPKTSRTSNFVIRGIDIFRLLNDNLVLYRAAFLRRLTEGPFNMRPAKKLRGSEWTRCLQAEQRAPNFPPETFIKISVRQN